MSESQINVNCQIAALHGMSGEFGPIPRGSIARRIKLMIRRRLSPQTERRLKAYINALANRIYRTLGPDAQASAPIAPAASVPLQAGARVRVRTRAEIDATLNHWRQLKGCTFMPEMAQYCGTQQRVLKSMERFVDERDLRVKKTRGIVLLEGVYCQGTADFGRCDRTCYLFWREEWLERIPG